MYYTKIAHLYESLGMVIYNVYIILIYTYIRNYAQLRMHACTYILHYCTYCVWRLIECCVYTERGAMLTQQAGWYSMRKHSELSILTSILTELRILRRSILTELNILVSILTELSILIGKLTELSILSSILTKLNILIRY